MPALARTASKDAVNCPARSRTRNRKSAAITEVHQEVTDLLGGPRPVRVRGDPEDVHIAGTDLDHEQAVQALERHGAVHVEEVRDEHGRCLGAQELPPRGVTCAVFGAGDIFSALRTRRIVDALTR
jgi:hypothetical protein